MARSSRRTGGSPRRAEASTRKNSGVDPFLARRRTVIEWAVLAAILVIAAVLLFWRLGAVYLWQDEANTAVLAVRMLKFGKPLAYDGVNLLTNDNFAAEDQTTIGERDADPQKAVDYIIRRGDLRADGSWVFHPWGQFIAAAVSIKLFGQTTVAARLPFALAGLVSVLLLYVLARNATGSPQVALLSSAMLLLNPYWILHSRQARYYALSTLLLLLTLLAYERWLNGRRWGIVMFVAAVWCWFQVDYGTVWPVLIVLSADALVARRSEPRQMLMTAVALAATIAPFVIFYEMASRLSVQYGSWYERFLENLFNMDRFVTPVAIWMAAALVLRWRWNRVEAAERRLVIIGLSTLIALLLWVPTVAPASYLRYVVMAVPIGCLVFAWTLVRGFAGWPPVLAWLVAGGLLLTPWVSRPFDGLTPLPPLRANGAVLRPEFPHLISEVFVARKDPNRLVVEWLREHAAPTDEILINYEDLPLMYYLPNPIRGGIAAFRAEDDAKSPPAFLVLRRSVAFVHWPVFVRELKRYDWEDVPLQAPDVWWGNNPDPIGQLQNPDKAADLIISRRRAVGAR